MIPNLRYTLCVIFLMAILSCDSRNRFMGDENETSKSVLVKKAEATTTQKLSSIFSSGKVIRLSSKGKGAFNINRMFLKGGNIYVLDKSIAKGVFVYNEKGEFVKQIGSVGEAPGEYLSINGLDVYGENVYISSSPNEVLVYDLAGNFIKNVSLEFEFTSFTATKNGFLFFNDFRGTSSGKFKNFNVIELDRDFKFVKGHFPFSEEMVGNVVLAYETNFQRGVDEAIYFSAPFSNKIYEFKNDRFVLFSTFSFDHMPFPDDFHKRRNDVNEFQKVLGYSRIDAPFFVSQAQIFSSMSIEGRRYYWSEKNSKKDLIEHFEDDLFGFQFYNFINSDSNYVAASVNMTMLTISLNPNNVTPLMPSEEKILKEYVEKTGLKPEMSEPIAVVFSM